MHTKITNALKISTLALVLSFGLSYVYAWTAPTVTAPNGNVAAPINTSITAQTKLGDISAWNLISNSLTTNTLKIPGATAVGQVLTALNTLGDVQWQTPTASAAGTGGLCGSARVSCTNSHNTAGDFTYDFLCTDFDPNDAGISLYVYSSSKKGCVAGNIGDGSTATDRTWMHNHCVWDLGGSFDANINPAVRFVGGTMQMLCWN